MKAIRIAMIIFVALVMAIPAFAQTTALVELVGAIESTTATTITINGLTIDISSAELNTTLELEKLVEVEGTLLADGTIQAREVDLLDDDSLPGEVELVGILESFEGTTMIVAGQSIDISTAEIYVGVVAGERVKVHAMLGTDGTWVAREVELFINTMTPGNDDDSPALAGEFEITGTLEQVGDGVIVVGGQTISTIGAEIKNVLVVGVRVKVHLSLVNGVLVAREVENAFRDDDDDSNDDNSSSDDNSNSSNDDNGRDDNSNRNVTTAVSAEQAIQIVLGVYPNTSIVEIELDDKFDGRLVWEVKTSHGLELNIDAESGVILTIEQDDDDRNDDSNSGRDDDDDDRDDDRNSGRDDDDDDRDDDNRGSNSGRGGDDDDDDDRDDDDDDDSDDD